jgi:hypothetical protein
VVEQLLTQVESPDAHAATQFKRDEHCVLFAHVVSCVQQELSMQRVHAVSLAEGVQTPPLVLPPVLPVPVLPATPCVPAVPAALPPEPVVPALPLGAWQVPETQLWPRGHSTFFVQVCVPEEEPPPHA